MIELEEKDFLELINNNNCVWFIGSKISERAPSCLPDAATLKKLVMKSLCKDIDYLKSLYQKCFPLDVSDEKSNKLAKSMNDLMPEVIFQAAQDIIGDYARKSLAFFNSAKFNFNHECLAQLMARNYRLHGKTIAMTTNFDCLLEEALKAIGLIEGRDFTVHYSNDKFSISDHKIIDIFKLHGSAQSDDSLGMTIRGVGLRLHDSKANVLKYVLENFTVLFAGYSGRDLDIYPVINESKCKDICWLMRPKPNPKRQADSLIQKFNGKVYKADLNEVFTSLNKALAFGILEITPKFDDAFVRDSLEDWGNKIGVTERFHILGNITRHTGELITSVELLEKANESVSILERGALLNDLGNVYNDINEWDKAQKAFEESFRIFQNEMNKLRMGIARSGLAYCFYKQDKWSEAITLFNESLRLIEDSEETKLHILDIKIGLGLTYYKQKLADQAIGLLEPTLKLVQDTGDIQTLIQARRILGLAYYQRNTGDDLDKALLQQNEALELSMKIEDFQGITQAKNNIAIILRRQKKFDEAIETHLNNIPNRIRLGDMRGMGQTYYNLGGLYTDKAIDSYQKSIEYYEGVKKPPIQDILASGEKQGKLYIAINDFEKAIKIFEINLERRKKLLDSKEKDLHGYANATGELGHAYLLNGETQKAQLQYDKVLEIYQNMEAVDTAKFKGSPRDRYNNAIKHLKTGLGLCMFIADKTKSTAYLDMINKIESIRLG